MDLDDVFAHQEEWPLVADPEEATGELCADEPGCVQAYTTAGADFLRFGSEEEAERAAAAAGDPVHRSGTTVIRFTDDSLIPEEREAVADWFDYNFVADTDLDEVFAEEVTGFYLQSDPGKRPVNCAGRSSTASRPTPRTRRTTSGSNRRSRPGTPPRASAPTPICPTTSSSASPTRSSPASSGRRSPSRSTGSTIPTPADQRCRRSAPGGAAACTGSGAHLAHRHGGPRARRRPQRKIACSRPIDSGP
ncbi:hypothetical protein ACFQXA_04505 [Nocardiopsis composta]